ncbi:hypothetical protein KP509_37G044800 [Ceratopteris richardii]|uniref:Pentatricopeptide repeat-containing protein n=1 Tax=Ceratopteris richardii TaxID=49495 RepID=A0A8T2Q877_CERRI|nr:hypothetical protein KP509_37G044800 [Ceratopteris richardii]
MLARPWLHFDRQKQWHDSRRSGLLGIHVVSSTCSKPSYASLWKNGWFDWLWFGDAPKPKELDMSVAVQVETKGLVPQSVTAHSNHVTPFVALLKACAKRKDLYQGTQIHNVLLKRDLLGKHLDNEGKSSSNGAGHERGARQRCLGYGAVLGAAVVDMYAKCGAFQKARQVLDDLPVRDVVTWSSLIAGYTYYGHATEALDCLDQMREEGLSPDPLTYAFVLKACGTTKALDKGKRLHDEIVEKGLHGKDLVLSNCLVDMYAKCGALSAAQEVLEELPERDVVSWSSLISGYAGVGHGEKALHLFEQMQHEGILPTSVTYLSVLKACASIGALDKGKEIHDEIARRGLLVNDVALGSAVVDMYAKCGALPKAQQVLDELPARNIVSWTALIGGYAHQGQGEQALRCFEQMQCEGHSPTAVTLVCVLTACGTIAAVDQGMYVKCGAVAKAQQVLEGLPVQDVVSWNALITGWMQLGEAEQAFKCLDHMQRKGFTPTSVTFLCLLKACGNIGAVDKGEQVHDEIIRQGLLEDDAFLAMAVVEMYAKCGALLKARQVVDELSIEHVVSWNALIAGYAQKGQGEEALDCFASMQAKGILPDAETFVYILKACGTVGLIENAQEYFVTMKSKFGIKPDLEHYSYLLDVFGRAGHLDKAVKVIQKIPFSDNLSAVWSALLDACHKWGDVNVGKWAFEQVRQLDRSDTTVYDIMGKIYAAAGMQHDAENVRSMQRKNSVV